jgi:ethanolamine utilization protein EutQ
LDRATLEQIIREAIAEEVGAAAPSGPKKVDPSGVIAIDPEAIPTEPFPFPIEADGVRLVDVMTLDESPRLGCGIMEMDHCAFPWTLTYDEVDYIISGTLEIVIDGRTVSASQGQILYIPKNTSITFSSPGKCRFMYVVYPANWSEQ